MGASYKGWTRGGSVEAVKAAGLILLLLLIDVWIFFSVILNGNTPAIEVLVALVALNIVVLGLVGHWSMLARVRKGMWSKFYPLSSTTVLDSIIGYLDGRGIKFKAAEEEHVYTENYSDVLRCAGPSFNVKLRPSSFPSVGVSVLAGPQDKKNAKVLRALMSELDDVMEDDLKEGIQRAASKDRKIKQEEE
jgi:hypothetical protein